MLTPKDIFAVSLIAVLLTLPIIWMSVVDTDFCNSSMTMDMHMSGFKSVFSDDADCLLLYVSAWTLDTPLKFAAALWGVVLLAVATEATASLRREGLRATAAKVGLPLHHLFTPKGVAERRGGGSGSLDEVGGALLYAFHVCLGYLLMLIAMTYSVEMLVYLLSGLALGRLAFNSGVPAGSSTPDPCCASLEEADNAPQAAGSHTPYRPPPSGADYGSTDGDESYKPLV